VRLAFFDFLASDGARYRMVDGSRLLIEILAALADS